MSKGSYPSGSTLTTGKRSHEGRRHARTQLEPTRAYLKRRWETEIDDRKSMYGPQLDNLEPFAIYVQSLVARHVAGEVVSDVWDLDGGRVAIFRSSPQIVRGVYAAAVRYDCAGAARWRPEKGVKATCVKHQKRVHRCIEYAGRLGLMEERAHQRNDAGEGLGILMVVTPAGVAQSVETTCRPRRSSAAHRANRRPFPAQSRVNFTGHLSYPLRESGVCEDQKSAGNSTDVTRRAPVARARRRKTSSDARKRQIQGRMPAPRSAPLAAHGTEERRAEPLTEDQRRREAVRRQLALWNQQSGVITVDGVVALLVALAFIALVGWLA